MEKLEAKIMLHKKRQRSRGKTLCCGCLMLRLNAPDGVNLIADFAL